MGIALLSLAGLFIAIYMYLYKIGKARFLGIEVALIGIVGYGVLLTLALLTLQPRFAGAAWPSRLLAVLAGGAVLFTAYLT
jgi:uncharacterized membrane protein